MGTDIHLAVEVKSGGAWEPIYFPNPYFGKYGDNDPKTLAAFGDRNYDIFAILGNVCNGHGFAGVPTGDGFNFISDNRGVPPDAHKKTKKWVDEAGDHSHSFVTLREILEFDWTQKSIHTGLVDAVTFEKWDRRKEWNPWPESYCGDVSGPQVRKIPVEQMRELVRRNAEKSETAIATLEDSLAHTYTRVAWETTYAEAAKGLFIKLLPELLKLAKGISPDDVRLVFSFGS